MLSLLRTFFAYLILSVGTYLMLRMIIDYSTFKPDTHFLAQKQDYIHNPLWITAFYVHVFSAIVALAAGFTQFSPMILRRYKKLHRTVGWIYAVDILIINFPAGLIMAYYANGLLPSKIAFTILDVLWAWFTYKAVAAARQEKFNAHREYMIRSFALTFSAIMLRTWRIILSNAFHPDPLTLYMIDAWMGFVPNLLLAEWIIRRRRKTLAPETSRKQQKRQQPAENSSR